MPAAPRALPTVDTSFDDFKKLLARLRKSPIPRPRILRRRPMPRAILRAGILICNSEVYKCASIFYEAKINIFFDRNAWLRCRNGV